MLGSRIFQEDSASGDARYCSDISFLKLVSSEVQLFLSSSWAIMLHVIVQDCSQAFGE